MSGDFNTGRAGGPSYGGVTTQENNKNEGAGPIRTRPDPESKLAGLEKKAYTGKSIHERKGAALNNSANTVLKARENELKEKAESLRTDCAIKNCLSDIQALKADPNYKPENRGVRVQLESGQWINLIPPDREAIRKAGENLDDLLNELEEALEGYVQGHLPSRSIADINRDLEKVKEALLKVGHELSDAGEDVDWQEKWNALMSSPITFKLTTRERDVHLERVPTLEDQ